jgi:ABC-type oligopeptide transport system substrate-binding subunit
LESGSARLVRSNLLQAMHLLEQAGFLVRGLSLVEAQSGEPLSVEFLIDDPNDERFVLLYKSALERLGIVVTVRTGDDAQYQTASANGISISLSPRGPSRFLQATSSGTSGVRAPPTRLVRAT